ncbi:MAG: efflux RND transporter permease subunit, partial [Spirochaetales bacterium]
MRKNSAGSRAFRSRVVLALLITAALLLSMDLQFGAQPPDGSRVVSVIIRHEGVEPRELERLITDPLERHLSGTPGIEAIRSGTEAGRVRVGVSVRHNESVDDVYDEIRDKVEVLYEQLPDAVQRPRIVRGDTETLPVAVLSVKQAGRSLGEIRRLAEDELRRELERIPGVGEVRVSGGSIEEVHIDVNPSILASTAIDWRDLSQRMNDRHAVRSAGVFRSDANAFPVLLDSRLDSYERLHNIEMGAGTGTMPLGRIASIRAGERKPRTISRIDGDQAILLSVTAASEANIISMAGRIEVLRNQWTRERGIITEVLADTGGDARSAVGRTLAALTASLLSVLIVVAVGSGSPSRAIETALVIPTAVLFAAATFAWLEIPLDAPMLAGFAVSSGLIVDTAIVLNRGGGRTTSYAVATSVVTTVASLLPFLFFPDIFGSATGIAAASAVLVAISFPVALLVRACRFFSDVSYPPFAIPRRLSSLSLRHPVLALTTAVVVVILTAVFAFRAGSSPSAVTSAKALRIHVEFESGASVQSVDRRSAKIAARLGKLDAVKRIEYVARRDNATIAIEPAGTKASGQITRAVERLDAEAADATLRMLLPPGSSQGITPVELAVTGPDREQTRELATSLAGILTEQQTDIEADDRTLSGRNRAESVVLHFKEDPPALVIEPDRERLARSGLSVRSIGDTVRWALHGPVVLKWQTGADELDVRLRARREQMTTRSDLESLLIRSGNSSSVRLHSVARIGSTERPARIDRYNRQRASFITAMYPIRSIEGTMETLNAKLESHPMPPGYAVQVDLRYRQLIGRYRLLWGLLAVTAIAIVLLVAAASESLRVAAATLLFIPPTVSLTILPFLIHAAPLHLGTVVGAVIFIGIAVNNSVLIGFHAVGTTVELAIHKRAPDLLLAGFTTLLAAVPLLLLTWETPGTEVANRIARVLASGT